MTTTVTVKVHCAPDVEVKVYHSKGVISTLQDGDTYETYIHGDLEVLVKEVPKDS